MDRRPAIYLRKSKRDDDSADRQRVAVSAVAARDGLAVDEDMVFDDNGRSGGHAGIARRRGYLALVEAIEAGVVSTVYVRAADRLGRSIEESARLWRILESTGTRLCDQSGCFDGDAGWQSMTMQALIAEGEYRRAKNRSAYTVRMRRDRGDVKVGGHAAPYGSMWARVAGRGSRIVAVPNPDEPLQPLLEAVRATRGNVLAACRLLDARGLPSRSGRPWDPRSLTRAVDGQGLARARIAKGKSPRRLAPTEAPLSRLVVCHCGQAMTPQRDPRNHRWLGLVCSTGLKRGLAAHGRYTARARHVLELLRAEVPSVPVTLAGRAPTGPTRDELESARRRLGTAYADGALDEADYRARMDALLAELAALDESEPWSMETTAVFDWALEGPALGEALRRVVSSVTLGTDMRPASIEWRRR